MTIKVTVTNEDGREGHIIAVSVMGCSEPMQPDKPTQPLTELKPGESMQAYVHPRQYILVRESVLASHVDPAYK
jgi:hypothetical protein